MRATITVHMDNAAFEGNDAGDELARILGTLSERVSGTDFKDSYDRSFKLRDINGNTVGECKITK